MNIRKEFTETLNTVKQVLTYQKYFIIALVVSGIVFATLYYFIVASVADNSLEIALLMSGKNYIYLTIFSIFLMALLFGTYVSLVAFKFSFIKVSGGFFGTIGGFTGALGVGCPTCGAFLFSLFGAPLALTYLPFRGAELKILGILILFLSVYFVSRSMRGKCDV